MAESINHPFTNKVFKIEDVKSIAERLEKEAESVKDSRLEFIVSFDDRSTRSEEDASIFNDSAMTSKNIESIRMFYRHWGKKTDNMVNIDITHGNSNFSSDNSWTVSGKERSWVRGMETDIQERLSATDSQGCYGGKGVPFGIALFALYVTISFFCSQAISDFLKKLPNTDPNKVDGEAQLYIYFFGAICGLMLILFLESKFRKFFPKVEIRIGKKRLEVAKRIKMLSGLVAIEILLPIVMSWYL